MAEATCEGCSFLILLKNHIKNIPFKSLEREIVSISSGCQCWPHFALEMNSVWEEKLQASLAAWKKRGEWAPWVIASLLLYFDCAEYSWAFCLYHVCWQYALEWVFFCFPYANIILQKLEPFEWRWKHTYTCTLCLCILVLEIVLSCKSTEHIFPSSQLLVPQQKT